MTAWLIGGARSPFGPERLLPRDNNTSEIGAKRKCVTCARNDVDDPVRTSAAKLHSNICPLPQGEVRTAPRHSTVSQAAASIGRWNNRFCAKRPFIKASRSGEANYIAISIHMSSAHRCGPNGCARINCCQRSTHLFFAVGRGRRPTAWSHAYIIKSVRAGRETARPSSL
jgi:hypothetical protein